MVRALLTPRTYAAAAVLLLAAGCGDGGAVATSASLDDLGRQMSGPAADTLALVRGTAVDAKDEVSNDASKDVPCQGGKRRQYVGTVTGPMAPDEDEAAVRNRLSLIAQARLKKAGAEVTTDLGKSAEDVPARLEFVSKPSDEARTRTYDTFVRTSGSTWSWTIHGVTACVTTK